MESNFEEIAKKALAQRDELAICLRKLANEASASVELARECIGNTNANCLILRANEARAALAKLEQK